ncbi:zinc-binding dehydrogenase [Rhodococcus sp. NCIMB 12038]|uniref:zinc-binding dehydrogenase n=1 Tax=Rhodococcus sp. NCIMB 12038 TaxID=933800 RepID=UPI0015C66FBC|nr:zinc-binding dehydrogenase [Rhodococcus sp. NCIMB 12038]
MSVQSAFVMGAARVIGLDPIASRRDRAEQLGAETFQSGEDVSSSVREAAGRSGVDAVVDAVGADEVRIVKPRGRISVIGVNQSKLMPFPMAYAQVKESRVRHGLCSVQQSYQPCYA